MSSRRRRTVGQRPPCCQPEVAQRRVPCPQLVGSQSFVEEHIAWVPSQHRQPQSDEQLIPASTAVPPSGGMQHRESRPLQVRPGQQIGERQGVPGPLQAPPPAPAEPPLVPVVPPVAVELPPELVVTPPLVGPPLVPGAVEPTVAEPPLVPGAVEPTVAETPVVPGAVAPPVVETPMVPLPPVELPGGPPWVAPVDDAEPEVVPSPVVEPALVARPVVEPVPVALPPLPVPGAWPGAQQRPPTHCQVGSGQSVAAWQVSSPDPGMAGGQHAAAARKGASAAARRLLMSGSIPWVGGSPGACQASRAARSSVDILAGARHLRLLP